MVPAQRRQADGGARRVVFGKPFLLGREQRALAIAGVLRQGGRGCHKQHRAEQAGGQGHETGAPHDVGLCVNG
jgi:hypothetical protein